MELIDGVFYPGSNDNILVAITADYPGLVPASQVTETEVPALKRGSILVLFFLLPYNSRVLQGRSSRQKAEPAATGQQGAARPGRLKRPAVRIETPAQRYVAPSFIPRHYSQRQTNAHAFFIGKRALAGLYTERLLIAPPPARLQVRIWRRERIRGVRQVLLRHRMWINCPPPILRWKVP